MILHEKMSAQLPDWRERIKSLAKEHGEVMVDHVTVGQVIGGMRDIKSLLTDVSFVDPAQGILLPRHDHPGGAQEAAQGRAAASCPWSAACITCC